jgi:ABC-2 type transport system permease protein
MSFWKPWEKKMPIHDQSYRHWEGELKGHTMRWWVISKMGLKLIFKRKLAILFLLIPYVSVVVFGVIMYFSGSFSQGAPILKFDKFFYSIFLYSIFSLYEFLIVIFFGTGLITRDLKYNALPLYLSKPVTHVDYIAGKFGIIASCILFTTWLPAMILIFLNTVFLEASLVSWTNLFLIYGVTLYASLGTLVLGMLVLALSALCRTRRNTIILFLGVVFFGQILYNILDTFFRNDLFSLFSLHSNLRVLGNQIFMQSLPLSHGWYWSLAVLLGIVFLSVYVLQKKLNYVQTVVG